MWPPEVLRAHHTIQEETPILQKNIVRQHRELFRCRLLARGYAHKFIGSIFSRVSYADRHTFLFGRHEAQKMKIKSSISLTTENKTPALIALSLQHSQRADALGIAHAIFLQNWSFFLSRMVCPKYFRRPHSFMLEKLGSSLATF